MLLLLLDPLLVQLRGQMPTLLQLADEDGALCLRSLACDC